MTSDLEKAISLIEKLGLTTYQARVYAALVGIGREASAPEVSIVSGVPKSRIYDVLEELASKEYQLVRKLPSKDPRRYNYQARPPGEALDAFIDPVKEAAKQVLVELYQKGKKGVKSDTPRVYEETATLEELVNAKVEVIISPSEELTHSLRGLMKTPGDAIPIVTLPGGLGLSDVFCALGESSVHFFRYNPFGNLTMITVSDDGLEELFKSLLVFVAEQGNPDPRSRRFISLRMRGDGKFKQHFLTSPHFLVVTDEHVQVVVEDKIDLSLPLKAVSEVVTLEGDVGAGSGAWVTVARVVFKDAKGDRLGSLEFRVLGKIKSFERFFLPPVSF